MLGLIITLLVVGLIAGALARLLVPGKDPMGIVGTIVLGIVGAALADFLLGLLGIGLGGWIGYLIAGFIGACILIGLWRLIQGRRV